MTSLLIGAAIWLFTGLWVTAVWTVVLTQGVVLEEDKIAMRRYQSIMSKINATLPGWNHAYRVAGAAGFSEAVRRALADVFSFTVSWPWAVPLIAETLYEWWSEKAEE